MTQISKWVNPGFDCGFNASDLLDSLDTELKVVCDTYTTGMGQLGTHRISGLDWIRTKQRAVVTLSPYRGGTPTENDFFFRTSNYLMFLEKQESFGLFLLKEY